LSCIPIIQISKILIICIIFLRLIGVSFIIGVIK
jgi:hypothetical protein